MRKLFKYVVEGLIVALVAYLIYDGKVSIHSIAVIGITASAAFAIIDFIAPKFSTLVRQGAGLSLGATLSGLTNFSLPMVPGVIMTII